MSRLGASGRSGWVGGNQSTHSPSHLSRDRGDVDAELTPPGDDQFVHPRAHACRRALHRRLTGRAMPVVASPGTEVSPAVMAACRAITPPPYRPSPRITSSTWPNPGSRQPQQLPNHMVRQVERRRVAQRPLPGGADGSTQGGHDDSFGQGSSPFTATRTLFSQKESVSCKELSRHTRPTPHRIRIANEQGLHREG